jgi:geranylgeranyl diphosphate synthase type I
VASLSAVTSQSHQPISARRGAMPPEVTAVLARYHEPIMAGLRQAIGRWRDMSATEVPPGSLLESFYGQMEYHFGWRNADLSPAEAAAGKLLRPTLLLLACELAAGRRGGDSSTRADAATRALPAALAVELIHNFSLIHDDIEDGDTERHHRPTLWSVWGLPQATNTGDGVFALARLTLFDLVERGVPPGEVTRLAILLDRTCLRLCEGQHLDMSYERRHDVTTGMYLDMIERKTAELMACALEMGARLGGGDDALARELSAFGRSLGLGFQLRDDLLGIWAPRALLGKTEAGDLRRKKMSLPVIYALEHAAPPDRDALLAIYGAEGPASDDEVRLALRVLERTDAREHARAALREQCARARAALAAAAPDSATAALEPRNLLATLITFIAADAT